MIEIALIFTLSEKSIFQALKRLHGVSTLILMYKFGSASTPGLI